MATAAEIRQQINDLQNRLMMKEIELDDYFVQYEVLNKKLQNQLESETQIEPRDFQFTEPGLQAEVESKLRGYGEYTVPYELDVKDIEEREKELGRKLTVEDTRQLEQEKTREFQRSMEPYQFGTKKFKDPVAVSKGMSRIVDPKAGLVVDRKTGQIRKAKGLELQDLATLQPLTETIAGAVTSNPILQSTIIKGLGALADFVDVGDQTVIPGASAELFVEALKPQRIATPRQAEQMEAIKEESRKRRKEDLRRFFKKQGKTDEEVEEAIKEREEELIRFTDDIRPFAFGQGAKEIAEKTAERFLTQSPYLEGGIVETPLAAGLRSLNTTSAFAAPALDWVNDLIQTDTGRSVVAGTAASALPTYLQPFVSQVVSDTMKEKLAPIATRKGAGYEKTEMEGPLGQALTNMIKGQGLFSQLGAQSLPPETNYNPLDPTVQGSFANTVTTLLPEFAVPVVPAGAVVKPAQAVSRGILFAGQRKALENALKPVTKLSPKFSKATDLPIRVGDLLEPHTVSYKSAEIGADIVAASKVFDEVVDTGTSVKGLSRRIPQSRFMKTDVEILPKLDDILKSDDVVLRGVNKVADETIRVIKEGGKPKVASDLINRGIAVARLRNIPVFELDKAVVKANKDAVTEAWARTLTLVKRSRKRPLRTTEQTRLRTSLDVLNKNKIFEELPESVLKTPEIMYDAVRSTTSQVIRDNVLRTMPVDLVYISDNVAVPKTKIYTTTGRPTQQYTKYLEEHRELLDFKPRLENNQEVYGFTPDRLSALRGFQQQHGIQFSPGVAQKLENGQPFTAIEKQELFDSVGAQLALDYLDGTRLRTAGLQSDLAEAGIVAGDTLIPQVRGKKSTFAIKTKAVANAIRQFKKTATSYNPIRFGKSASASFRQFEIAIQQASDAAPKQTFQEFINASRLHGEEGINIASQRYMDLGVQLNRAGRETKAIRSAQPQIADVSPTLRDKILGMSPEEKRLRSKRGETAKKDAQYLAEQRMIKSKKASAKRTLLAQKERYGSTLVDNYYKDLLGRQPTYEELIELGNDFVENMFLYEEAVIRKQQWNQVLNTFFVQPDKVGLTVADLLETPKSRRLIDKAISVDDTKAFYEPNNLKEINPQTLKEVVLLLRKQSKPLREAGLSEGFFRKDENYVLPILQRAMSIQRLQNAQQAIKKFVQQEPDLVMDMNRTFDGTPGIGAVESISARIDEELAESLRSLKQAKLLKQDSIDLLLYQIKEILFDGMMSDVWRNSSRRAQSKFIERYLNKMIETESLTINMDSFIKELYLGDEAVLKSATFTNINRQVGKVFKRLDNKIQRKLKSPDADESLASDQARLLLQVGDELDGLLKDINLEYLGKMTGLGENPFEDALFSHTLQKVTDRLTLYGLDNGTLAEALVRLEPRVKMIGNENIALIHGIDIAESAKKITEIVDTEYFNTLLKQKALNKKPILEVLPEQVFSTMVGLMGVVRRYTTAGMLGGSFAPNLRFFANNRIGAPFILAGTVLNAPLRLGSIARIVARAFDFGLEKPVKDTMNAVSKILGRPKITDLSAANRVMTAPADEIVVTVQEGAKRNYTAGELRRAINESGMEYSRANAEFFDTEINAMMIDMGINAQGLNRYSKNPAYALMKKMYENFETGQKNVFTELGKYQDSELRRIVFVEYLRNGYSLEEAITAGKASMLDYSLLTPQEKKWFSNFIWFYAFQRTMITSQINAIYKGMVTGKPSLSLRLLRQQDVINRQTAEDYHDYTDQQLGRIYNIFSGDVDGIPLTVSGAPNPQIQMFDIMSTLTVAHNPVDLLQTIFVTQVEDHPFAGQLVKYDRAKSSGRIPPFPDYIIYNAEASGNLDYYIERYKLTPRARRKAGRPLTLGSDKTQPGVYYDFPKGEAGLASYKQFLKDETLAMAGAGIVVNRGMEALGQRFNRDFIRSEMFSAKRGDRIVTPEGEEVVPFEGRYLKSGTIQGGKISEVFEGDTQSAILWSLYQLGLATPLKGAPAEKNIIYQLNRVNRALDQADKESQ